MPELPEVETARRRIEKALKDQRLSDIEPDEKDLIVYDTASPREFREALLGAKVIGSGRKGKYFWLELDRRPWPVFHFGMTGNVEVRTKQKRLPKWGGLKLHSKSGGKESPKNQIPRFCRLRIVAENGTEVMIIDPRRFGRIRLARNPLSEPPISKLGFDPLEKFPSGKELIIILGKRRAPIKAVLLDQSLFAGVGNWIADEVLFQSRISPHNKASELTLAQVTALRKALLSVIIRAVKVGADSKRFPRHWLFHARWGKVKDARTWEGHKIRHETIGGRTTAWVPDLQK